MAIQYQCNYCSNHYPTEALVKKHITRQHTSTIECDHCHQMISRKDNFERHIRITHKLSSESVRRILREITKQSLPRTFTVIDSRNHINPCRQDSFMATCYVRYSSNILDGPSMMNLGGNNGGNNSGFGGLDNFDNFGGFGGFDGFSDGFSDGGFGNFDNSFDQYQMEVTETIISVRMILVTI